MHQKMNLFLWIIGGLLILCVLIFLAGIMLPSERVVSRSSVFDAPADILYRIVTNNDDWQYRSGLKDLVIIEREGDNEVWDEISENGATIRFRTKEKIPRELYSFDMESAMFSGYWVATFQDMGNNQTIFEATEHIQVKNPFVKVLSYLFFDVGKLMDTYQSDLRRKVESLKN